MTKNEVTQRLLEKTLKLISEVFGAPPKRIEVGDHRWEALLRAMDGGIVPVVQRDLVKEGEECVRYAGIDFVKNVETDLRKIVRQEIARALAE